jgi:ABC-type Na+ efflux pump permease subunit
MKHGFPLMPVLLLAASASCHAFTLDIASDEITKFGQGPRSVFVPGYGEVAFESALDGALVVDSAYASTGKIDVPTATTTASEPPTAASEDSGYVEIAARSTASANDQTAPETAPVAAMEKPPERVNSIPETASAALGLLGILLFLLRRWR